MQCPCCHFIVIDQVIAQVNERLIVGLASDSAECMGLLFDYQRYSGETYESGLLNYSDLIVIALSEEQRYRIESILNEYQEQQEHIDRQIQAYNSRESVDRLRIEDIWGCLRLVPLQCDVDSQVFLTQAHIDEIEELISQGKRIL